MDKHYKLYYHKNLINNKYYIGITSKEKVEYRWGANGCNYNNQLLSKAIQKYGWDNFEHIIVLDNLSEIEAIQLEKEYIIKFNSLVPYGYNVTPGGETTYKNNGILCLETNEVFLKDEIDDFLMKHNELKDKYTALDIIDCCEYKLKYLKVPWKNKYYHFIFNKYSQVPTAEEIERHVEIEVNQRKEKNSKYKNGRKFTYKGVIKVKKTCKACGDLFVYDFYKENEHKQRLNYCEKCQRRRKS